ncbi:flagellin [Psychrosphaera sp. F3M07]|uniref:flagellin N-terminal helical domain-containing protein n=1 Tax=Psychrosphaera sp. F3M07 TaxID=2841560 RepID=UPI001C09BB6E|nr:flagellin [Psychrosphaera sp. F3M07]MBU2917447.1 flagellin [Psychrosphaera sp. F3M07]
MKVGSNNISLSSSNTSSTSLKEQQESAMKRLVSGLKINSAKDDAAGLQIANRLANQSSGIQVVMRNASDAFSYSSVAESALSGINDAAGRINELSLRAANASMSAADRDSIQQEIVQLQGQVSDIQSQTSFAGQTIFTQSNNNQFQVGANANTTIGLSLSSINEQIDAVNSIDVTTITGAQDAISISQTVNENISGQRGKIGAFQNRIESTINNLSNSYVQSESAKSRIEDTDYAKATADNIQASIMGQANVAVQAQANLSKGLALKLLN